MIIRAAFFEGSVKEECEKEFEDLIGNVLLPLWQKFPGALDVRILWSLVGDPDSPRYLLILETTYPDKSALDAALNSEVREATRAPTERLKNLFEGRVFHITFDSRDPAASAAV